MTWHDITLHTYMTWHDITLHTYIHTYMHACIHTDIQTYRHTNIQTYRHTDIQTYRHTNRQTDIQTYKHTDIQTYRHTYIHTNSPTITPPSLSYFLFPGCFSVLSLSLEKLLACGVIRSYNLYIYIMYSHTIPLAPPWTPQTLSFASCTSAAGSEPEFWRVTTDGKHGKIGIWVGHSWGWICPLMWKTKTWQIGLFHGILVKHSWLLLENIIQH